jgi:hypothetical protein
MTESGARQELFYAGRQGGKTQTRYPLLYIVLSGFDMNKM